MQEKRKKCTEKWEENCQVPVMETSYTESEEGDCNEHPRKSANMDRNIIEEVDCLQDNNLSEVLETKNEVNIGNICAQEKEVSTNSINGSSNIDDLG